MSCKKQYGIIPYMKVSDKIKVVLITSRTNGFWILPKGNLVKNKDKYQSAIQEGWEEAGVKGKLYTDVEYSANFKAHGQPVKLKLYPLEVETLDESWPEKDDRERKVIGLKKAMDLIELDAFSCCLKSFAKDFR